MDQSPHKETAASPRTWMRRIIVTLVGIELGWLVLANLFPFTPVGPSIAWNVEKAREWFDTSAERRSVGFAAEGKR